MPLPSISLTALLIVLLLVSGCTTQSEPPESNALAPLRKALHEVNYDLFYPISTGETPGYLFYIETTPEGTNFRKTLCAQAFTVAPRFSGETLIPAHTFTSTSDMSAMLGLSSDLLEDKGSFEAELSRINATKVRLALNNVQEYEIPVRHTKEYERAVTTECELNIRAKTNSEGEFSYPVYLIVGTAVPKEMVYDFVSDSTFSANAEIGLKSLFTLNPQYENVSEQRKRLSFTSDETQRYVIGYRSIAIGSIEMLREVAGDGGTLARFTQEENPGIAPDDALRMPEPEE